MGSWREPVCGAASAAGLQSGGLTPLLVPGAALLPAQTEGGCSRCPFCPAPGAACAAREGGRARSLPRPWRVWPLGPSWAPRPPVPVPPRCRGAGDWLTPICSWWEPHCSGAVYCIRGMLSSNQLSGRPSPDLIPTLAWLCACSVLMGGLAGQDPDSALRGQIPPASVCLSGTGLALVSPGDLAGGWRGPAALATPFSSPRRRTALCVAAASAGPGQWEQQPATITSSKSWHLPSTQVLFLG